MGLNKIALDLISKYKEKTEYKPHTCKYVPTCSTYARQCFTEYNFLFATCLTLWRIIRCNPLTKPKVEQIPRYKTIDIYLYDHNLTIRSEGKDLVVLYYNKKVNYITVTPNNHYTFKNNNYEKEATLLLKSFLEKEQIEYIIKASKN